MANTLKPPPETVRPEIVSNGDKHWRLPFLRNLIHRDDGPAVEGANGTRCWYQFGNLHREDGPAIEYTDGSVSYYLDNERFPTKEAWEEALKLTLVAEVHDS